MMKKSNKKQKTLEPDGKVAIHAGGANHFQKGEAVGGRLYLLEDRLVFKSHKFNIQNHRTDILLSEITDVKFFNTFGLVPNGLKIYTGNKRPDKFVVNKRKLWRSEIKKLLNRNS